MKDIHNLKKYKANPIVGIYFLWDSEELVYIGQSTDIHKRISEHLAVKKFTHYSFISCQRSQLNKLEKSYIQTYNPILNKTFSRQTLATELVEISLCQNEFKIIGNVSLFKLTDHVIQIPLIKKNKGFQFVGFRGELKVNVFIPNTYYGELLYNGVNYFIVYDSLSEKYNIK